MDTYIQRYIKRLATLSHQHAGIMLFHKHEKNFCAFVLMFGGSKIWILHTCEKIIEISKNKTQAVKSIITNIPCYYAYKFCHIFGDT